MGLECCKIFKDLCLKALKGVVGVVRSMWRRKGKFCARLGDGVGGKVKICTLNSMSKDWVSKNKIMVMILGNEHLRALHWIMRLPEEGR